MKRQIRLLHFREASRLGNFIDTESRREVIESSGRKKGSYCLMGTVSVGDDKNIQKQVMVTVVQHCECTQCNCKIKNG